jgi:Holliday junction resolvase RusA-like endonuclease
MAQYDIVPAPKPRMTRADKWKKPPRPSVARYRAFADECRWKIGRLDLNHKALTFVLPMPPSWSDEKKDLMRGRPHTPTPDLSNLLKALEDALYSKKYTGRDDSTIHTLGSLRKIWHDEGAIWIDE